MNGDANDRAPNACANACAPGLCANADVNLCSLLVLLFFDAVASVDFSVQLFKEGHNDFQEDHSQIRQFGCRLQLQQLIAQDSGLDAADVELLVVSQRHDVGAARQGTNAGNFVDAGQCAT